MTAEKKHNHIETKEVPEWAKLLKLKMIDVRVVCDQCRKLIHDNLLSSCPGTNENYKECMVRTGASADLKIESDSYSTGKAILLGEGADFNDHVQLQKRLARGSQILEREGTKNLIKLINEKPADESTGEGWTEGYDDEAIQQEIALDTHDPTKMNEVLRENCVASFLKALFDQKIKIIGDEDFLSKIPWYGEGKKAK